MAAQAELERARQLGADAGATIHLMVHALLLQGQNRRAVEEAANAAPEHTVYAARISGLALLALGDNAGALAQFDRAIDAAPGSS